MSWACPKCNSENPDEAEECQACKLEARPYYRKILDTGQGKRDQFTCEVNSEERAWIEQLKNRLDFKSDSQIMKLCLENAIMGKSLTFSEKTWRYVLNTKRQRKSNFGKLPEPSPEQNAMQI